MRARITKRPVDSVKTPDEGWTLVWDSTLTGFGLTVYSSGRRSFFIEYAPRGRRRRMVLGQYGALTVDAAQSLAQANLEQVAHGEDPWRSGPRGGPDLRRVDGRVHGGRPPP